MDYIIVLRHKFPK